MAAAVRAGHGEHVIGELYRAMGQAVWHAEPPGGADFQPVLEHTAEAGDLEAILAQVGLPTDLAAAAQSPAWDPTLRADTDQALERVGGGVGTPILSVAPPDGPAFFGPVISEVPGDGDAVMLWDAVETLARWPGFAELKRSLRQFPNTPVTRHIAGDETRLS